MEQNQVKSSFDVIAVVVLVSLYGGIALLLFCKARTSLKRSW